MGGNLILIFNFKLFTYLGRAQCTNYCYINITENRRAVKLSGKNCAGSHSGKSKVSTACQEVDKFTEPMVSQQS